METKTTKEKIEIMKAYDEGKAIQCLYLEKEDREKYGDKWFDISSTTFNWEKCDYRVKPEHKTRPMTFEEVVEYWKEHRTEIFKVLDGSHKAEYSFIIGVHYEDETFGIGGYDYSLKDMHNFVTKEDGTKFEVEE